MKDQQSCMPLSTVYIKAANGSTSPDMTTVFQSMQGYMVDLQRQRATWEEKEFHKKTP